MYQWVEAQEYLSQQLSVSRPLVLYLQCQKRGLGMRRMSGQITTWVSLMGISEHGWQLLANISTAEQYSGSTRGWFIETTDSCHSELGIATHYVAESSLPGLVQQITHLPDPTYENISKLVSSYSPSPSTSTGPSSKSNPDGASPLTPEIRQFLDNVFSAPTVQKIYERLRNASERQDLSEEVRAWAKVQIKYLEEKSPTGMAVALEGFNKARSGKRLDKALKNGASIARWRREIKSRGHHR